MIFLQISKVVQGQRRNLKVSEEVEEEKVNDDKRGEYEIHESYKLESPSKPLVSFCGELNGTHPIRGAYVHPW